MYFDQRAGSVRKADTYVPLPRYDCYEPGAGEEEDIQQRSFINLIMKLNNVEQSTSTAVCLQEQRRETDAAEEQVWQSQTYQT